MVTILTIIVLICLLPIILDLLFAGLMLIFTALCGTLVLILSPLSLLNKMSQNHTTTKKVVDEDNNKYILELAALEKEMRF